MKTYIAILRGINVGGHRVIKMDALKVLMFEIGLENVQTYIQSGNIVFQKKDASTHDLEKSISAAILDKFSFEVPVIVLEHQELSNIIAQNPFVNTNGIEESFLHLTFLSAKPNEGFYEQIKELKFGEDSFLLKETTLHIYCPNGYGNTKLNNSFFESKLKVNATTRNWKTSKKLLDMAESLM